MSKNKMKNEIVAAYCKIREIDNTIPDVVLDFMKNAAIEKMSAANSQPQGEKGLIKQPPSDEEAENIILKQPSEFQELLRDCFETWRYAYERQRQLKTAEIKPKEQEGDPHFLHNTFFEKADIWSDEHNQWVMTAEVFKQVVTSIVAASHPIPDTQ